MTCSEHTLFLNPVLFRVVDSSFGSQDKNNLLVVRVYTVALLNFLVMLTGPVGSSKKAGTLWTALDRGPSVDAMWSTQHWMRNQFWWARQMSVWGNGSLHGTSCQRAGQVGERTPLYGPCCSLYPSLPSIAWVSWSLCNVWYDKVYIGVDAPHQLWPHLNVIISWKQSHIRRAGFWDSTLSSHKTQVNPWPLGGLERCNLLGKRNKAFHLQYVDFELF